jgi:hypothetical protein
MSTFLIGPCEVSSARRAVLLKYRPLAQRKKISQLHNPARGKQYAVLSNLNRHFCGASNEINGNAEYFERVLEKLTHGMHGTR